MIIKLSFFTLIFFLCVSGALAQEYDYCIHDAAIVAPQMDVPLVPHQDVFLKGEKIALIRNATTDVPKNCKHIINGSGKFLMPGLTDMHVHLPSDHIEKFLALNLAAGVTTIRSMRGKYSHIDLKKKIRTGAVIGPDLYIASPYFPNKSVSREHLPDTIRAYKAAGFDCVKVLDVPDSQYYEALMKAAKAENIPVVGHALFDSIPIERVIESDYACIEHLHGLYGAFVKDSNSLQALVRQMKEHRTYNCPTLDYYNVIFMQVPMEELLARAGLEYIDSATRNKWAAEMRDEFKKYNSGDKDSLAKKHEKNRLNIQNRLRLIKKLNDLGAPMIMSPAEANDDFGVPGFCVWEEMKLFSRAGISNKDILKISTSNAAEFFHEENDWGSIKAGCKANMILLSKNPLESIDNIQSEKIVFLNGKAYSKGDLERMLFVN
jgi:imidazolonepropionase-like amidohydrolase